MHWWLPPAASTFVVRYRARPGRKAFYTHGSTRAEVIWTAIPAVTMVALGLVSNHYWVLIKDRKSVPPNAYHIGVHAKQFEWQITYPGPDGKLVRATTSRFAISCTCRSTSRSRSSS